MTKNIYQSQFIFLTLSLVFLLLPRPQLQAQTTMEAGDLAFTLLNMEGSDTDAFGFVLLKAVEAGTVIQVTDKEYTTGVGFEANEGVLTFTFMSAFPCGTEVIVTDVNPESPVYDFQANLTGINTTTTPDNAFQLSTSGETLIAFQSENLTNPPAGSFISALANTGVDFGEMATGSGDLPPGLTVGTSAMAMTANPDGAEWDNIKYDCSTTANSDLDALRMAIYTPANWLTDDTTPLPATACSPAFSCADPCTDPVVTFAISMEVFCVDGGVQTGLSGGTPSGGTYSGAGVVDAGDGMTFSFNPVEAGVGMHTLRYDYTTPDGCSGFAEATVTVNDVLTVSGFTTPDSVSLNSAVQNNLGGATPAGGVYSGPGVTDAGNGSTYIFDPAAAGVGTHTITYTVTDANGCTGSSTAEVDVFQLPVSAIADIDEVDANGVAIQENELVAVQGVVHCIDFSEGQALEFWIIEAGGDGISVFRSVDIDGYVVTEGDELYIEGTLSTFNGLLDLLPSYIELISQDNMLNTPIEVTELNEDNESKYVMLTEATITEGTTLMPATGGFEFSVTTADMNTVSIYISNETGIDTMLLNQFIADATGTAFSITGIVSQSDNSIPFTEGYELWVCDQDDFMFVVDVQEPLWATELQVYPSPTRDWLHLNAPVVIETYRLMDAQGRLVQQVTWSQTQSSLSLQHLPKGIYQLQLMRGSEWVTRRVVKQ